MPRNAIQITYDDGSVQVLTPAPSPQPTPAPPAQSAIIKGVYADGIPDQQVGGFASQFGAGWVRIWHTVNWNESIGVSHPTLIRAATLKAQGLKVLVVCTPPEVTGKPPATTDIAAMYFAQMAKSAQSYIDAWEIYNEPNLANYNADYSAHASSWILDCLAPAYQVLHAAGQFVVSGGWSGAAKGYGFEYALSKGLASYCDAVGYHPYGANSSEQQKNVIGISSLIGAMKPLWITEWNLHMDASNPTQWMQELKTAAIAIKPYVNAVFHFRLVQTTQPAGVAAPFDVNLNRRSIWYDGTVAAMSTF